MCAKVAHKGDRVSAPRGKKTWTKRFLKTWCMVIER